MADKNYIFFSLAAQLSSKARNLVDLLLNCIIYCSLFSWPVAVLIGFRPIVSTSEKCFFIHLIVFRSDIFHIMKLICISFKNGERSGWHCII